MFLFSILLQAMMRERNLHNGGTHIIIQCNVCQGGLFWKRVVKGLILLTLFLSLVQTDVHRDDDHYSHYCQNQR